jgi:hypothetical protein
VRRQVEDGSARRHRILDRAYSPLGEVVRKHQEPDIVEEGGEVQIVHFAWGQADRLSDQQRDRSRAAAVACLQGSA